MRSAHGRMPSRAGTPGASARPPRRGPGRPWQARRGPGPGRSWAGAGAAGAGAGAAVAGGGRGWRGCRGRRGVAGGQAVQESDVGLASRGSRLGLAALPVHDRRAAHPQRCGDLFLGQTGGPAQAFPFGGGRQVRLVDAGEQRVHRREQVRGGPGSGLGHAAPPRANCTSDRTPERTSPRRVRTGAPRRRTRGRAAAASHGPRRRRAASPTPFPGTAVAACSEPTARRPGATALRGNRVRRGPGLRVCARRSRPFSTVSPGPPVPGRTARRVRGGHGRGSGRLDAQ